MAWLNKPRNGYALCPTRTPLAYIYNELRSYSIISRIMIFSSIRCVSRLSRQTFMSLEEFLLRQKILHTYRGLMRLIYKHHEKQELAKFAREEFHLNKHETDLAHRKYLLLTGTVRINEMSKLLGLNANF